MIQLPKSWAEVKIDTWQELSLVESETQIGVLINKLSILADCDPEEIRQMPIVEFNKVQQQLLFMNKPLKKEIKLKIEIDGKKYGMIPDLNFLTTGEFLDAENWKDKSVENLHLYLALLYRPIISEDGDDYKIEPHKAEGFMKRAELFRKNLTIEYVWGTLLFFSSLGLNCTKAILDFLEAEEAAKIQTPTKKTTQTQSVSKKRKPRSSKKSGSGTI